MDTCIDGAKHNFKPLSDSYAKYKPEANASGTGGSYSYNKREEYTPGVLYATLFCSGCAKVVEVVAQNTTDKELHNNADKEESRKDKEAETCGQPLGPQDAAGATASVA